MEVKSSEIDKELGEIVALVSSGSKNPAALQAARERAERIRLQAREKYGVRNLAVELVHEARDGK